MAKLHELTKAYLQVQEMADNADNPEAIIDTLESIGGAIEEKAVNIVKVIANTDSDIKAIDLEIERLTKRKNAITNRQRAIKEYIQEQMQRASLERIKTPLVTISLAKCPPKVVIENETLIPASFKTIKQEIVIDKKEINKQLKAGKQIPGTYLEQGQRLSIK